MKSEDDVLADAKNGDSALLSKEMAEEEEKLLEARVKGEDAEREKLPEDAAKLNDLQFSKLDELLTQTQLYSEFLLEKMDDITLVRLLGCFFMNQFSGCVCLLTEPWICHGRMEWKKSKRNRVRRKRKEGVEKGKLPHNTMM